MSEHNAEEPQATLVIETNLAALQGRFLAQLQHLLDILAVSYAGLGFVDENAYSAFAPFFQLSPAQNQRLTKDSAVAEASEWYLRSIIRDAIEIANAFIENCWLVCSLFSLSKKGKITGEEYNRLVGPEHKKFHALGLPIKLRKLREGFGVYSELEPHIISINTARACLVHRLGVITALDTDESGGLIIHWRTANLVAISPDGSQEYAIDKRGTVVEGGWTVTIRTTDIRKAFRQGERIELSYPEITYTVFSLMSFALTLTQSIQDYGKRVGIVIAESRKQEA